MTPCSSVIHDGFSVTEVATKLKVSRQTVYRWMARYEGGGLSALEERSHRPLRSPNQLDALVEAQVVDWRRLHPSWGPVRLCHETERVFEEMCHFLVESDRKAANTLGDLLDLSGRDEKGCRSAASASTLGRLLPCCFSRASSKGHHPMDPQTPVQRLSWRVGSQMHRVAVPQARTRITANSPASE